MKHLKLLMILFIGVAISTAYSCNKDDDTEDGSGGESGSNTCYVKKITNSDGSYSMIMYNADNKVTEIVDYDDAGTADGKTELIYSNSKLDEARIIKANGDLESKVIFSYDTQGKVEKGDLYSMVAGTLSKVGFYEYTFTGDNMTKQAEFLDIAGVSKEVNTFEFTYDAGNVMTVKEYTFDLSTATLKLSETRDLVYDGKINPFQGIGLEFIIADPMTLSKANPTQITVSDDQGQVLQDESMNIVYVYKDNKYPTKQTATTFDNFGTEVTLLEYDCK